MEIPKFHTQKELFDFLVKNKTTLITQKKSAMKRADAVNFSVNYFERESTGTEKVISNPSAFTGDRIKTISVINTTNFFDSHSDVHINGIWNKTVKENKNPLLLQEHDLSFKGIISDEVKSSVKILSWKELGYDATGDTQALFYESTISKSRNPYMFDQYVKGHVKNHSVGMQYISLSLAINDEKRTEEYSVWKKYADKVVNKSDAERNGFFWAVTEARAVEGSAVVIGSNTITPTLSVEEKHQPFDDTDENGPDHSTQKIDYNFLINNLN